jgi:serine/threonine protein kinase
MEVSLQSFRKRFTYDPQKDLLGKGGFGDVYKAYDNEDQIFVALKIAHASADDKHNLINEIRRFKKLNHPNIVKHIEAYEVNTGGFDIHGRPIINHVGVLEYADKGTLAEFLKNQSVAGFENPQRFRDILEDLFKDIIDGLAYLHTNNIIHRDLKPTNILLFSEGDKFRAKITDFGIAKKADATAASTQLVGTVEYMAPEYFTTGNITKASDIWSLGVMLLEALTGTHPFGKTTQGLSNEQIIHNILNKDLQSLENFGNLGSYKGLLTRCMIREPQLRPQNEEELKAELTNTAADSFGEKTQVLTQPESLTKTSSKPTKKKLLVAFFLLLFFLCIGVIGWLISNGKLWFNPKPAKTQSYTLQNAQTNNVDSSSDSTSFETEKQQSIIPAPSKEVLGDINPPSFAKSQKRKLFCWFSYQEKKIGNGKSGVEVYSVVNYVSEIVELEIPKNLSDAEVSYIFKKHIKAYCPIKEKNSVGDYVYIISEEIFSTSPTIEGASESIKERYGSNYIQLQVCNLNELKVKITTFLNPTKKAVDNNRFDYFAIAYWFMIYKDENGEFKRRSFITNPIQIQCANRNNYLVIAKYLEAHINMSCNVPQDYKVGVSFTDSYLGALEYINNHYKEASRAEICDLNSFQNFICDIK